MPHADFVFQQLARGWGAVSRRVLSPANRARVEQTARRAVSRGALAARPTATELTLRVERLARQAVAFSLGLRDGDSLVVRGRDGDERVLRFDDVELPTAGGEPGWRSKFERSLRRDLGMWSEPGI